MEKYNKQDIALGSVPSIKPISVFGHAHDGLQTTPTDIWDRADATPTQQIWVAPTQARKHNIKSTSTSDLKVTGTGARIVRVFGLKTWNDEESYEDIEMNGITNVLTGELYVIIHKIECIAFGASGPNVGTITATAEVDGTVTAAILAGIGKTLMAILGIPAGKKLLLNNYFFSGLRSAIGVGIEVSLLVAPLPTLEPSVFIVQNIDGKTTDGGASRTQKFNPPYSIPGPAIIKVQGLSTLADTDASGGFNGELHDIIE